MLTAREVEILRLRKKGLTQVQIANKIGITQAAVSSFEKNAKHKVEDARRTLAIHKEIGERK